MDVSMVQLQDAGQRLQTSVGRLLDMIEESTSQLLDTRQTQSELMEQLDERGTSLEQITAHCNDLEERLKEETERKDFLALELHKAEGLIEGYTSERDLQDQKVQELEEQKYTLVLELETTKNKLQDMLDTHSEAQQLKKQIEEQEEMLKQNVGEEAQVLMLEVSRLSSENREKDSKIQQVHEKFESRVRELENSGEDMEHHYSKLLDDRKQELADLKLQVDALEKQLKSKKQFIEEQSVEREQEHEDYQKELAKWKQTVQDLEKHQGSETNLHREVEELSDQLQARIDQHNEALLQSQNLQRTVQERDSQIQDLKSVIQSTEQELQEKTTEMDQMKEKLSNLEEELSKRPFPDDDLADSVKSDGSAPKSKESFDLEETVEHYRERLLTQMSVEEELRQAANRTKEELVREKHALQTQVNENLVQISALRNKLDEMRHRKDLSDPSDLSKRLDVEREKAEQKDKQISDMKAEIDKLLEKMEIKEQELEHHREKERTKRTSPVEGLEYESDKEIERQMESLKRDNRNLKDKLRLAEAGSVTDMSGLSQGLIDEKNQEIDHLSEQVFRLQTEFNELKAEKGVEGLTSIQQEMEDFEASRQEKMTSLETEVTTLKATLADKETQLSTLQARIDELSEQVKREDEAMVQEILHEKEKMVTDLTIQIESLQTEVHNLTEFQTKLEEDFDTVQTMLDEKQREIESLTKELEFSSVGREEHSLVIKHEVEIARLKKEVREKENVVEEKLEELAELSDKVELLESAESKSRSDSSDQTERVKYLEDRLEKTEEELEEVRKSLSESVQMSEQQLQLVENKDEEYVKLKLDIQQTIASKDKVIKEQKQSLKDMEEEMTKVNKKLSQLESQEEQKDKEVVQLRAESTKLEQTVAELSRPGREAERESPTLVALRSQLQNQEEVILTLGSDLQESRSALQEREREIEEIQARNVQMRRDEADTVGTMQNQMTQLQRELEELRLVAKGREESPFDQNGRTPLTQSMSNEGQSRSPERVHLQKGQGYGRTHESPSFDDSGHQSYDQSTQHQSHMGQGRSSPPGSQSRARRSPPSSHHDNRTDDDHHPQDQGQRVYIDQRSRTNGGLAAVQEAGITAEMYTPEHAYPRNGSPRQTSTNGMARMSPEDRDQSRDQAQEISPRSQSEGRRRSPPQGEDLDFDRDGNLRPHYSRSVDSQPSRNGADSGLRPSSAGQGQTWLPSESQGHRGLPGHQGEGERMPVEGTVPEGLSSDAERYIQQMRRELLITKTALMQIQRGERLDRAMTPEESELVQDVLSDVHLADQGRSARRDHQESSPHAGRHYSSLPDDEEVNRLRREVERLEEELKLYRSTSDLSARDFVQKVMSLKDELSSEHQRHIEELTTRARQENESQLEALRIKFNDETEHLKSKHTRELENKLDDQRRTMERAHKKEMNKLIVQHQEEMSLLKARGSGSELGSVGRQDGVGQERTNLVNGHTEPMSGRVQGILRRLHTEGVQVLTISELETLRRSQTQSSLPQSADVESLQAGWENERQSYLSTIQSLKDLLSQTNKLQGLEKDDDDDDFDIFAGAEASDWRAELLRAIAYVFTKERETLLAELRSHVLSHPNTSFDEIQRLEHKIRTMESHHHDSMDQIFNADRQSMLAEIRDLHAHATIARMHNHEERAKATESLQNTEDQAIKKERQLKRQVQLLEFKIQQEKILQDDLRTSLDVERTRSTELSTALDEEKTSTFDLQNTISTLQVQNSKLRENFEREQSRYVSVTNALEEEKSKSLNLSELLESERQTLWRVQNELESLKHQQTEVDSVLVEELQTELSQERERRAQAESRLEIDHVTSDNLRQELDMEKRRQVAIEAEMNAKLTNLYKVVESEKQRVAELDMALERERNLAHHLRQKLEAQHSNSEEMNGRERAFVEDLKIQLENQRSEIEDLTRAIQKEKRDKESMSASGESEKRLLKDHLDQERSIKNELKREVDQLQFDRLEAVNKLQKEREAVQRLKMEQDKVNEEVRKLRNLELQRDQDREAERFSDRDTMRQADREKEEYKMKLNEQELETQRLTQKVSRLEEQVAESREKELRAIRDLEHERLRVPAPGPEMISAQTSPRLAETREGEGMAEQRERFHVYKSQLESMCQSLHYLVLRCRDQLNKATHGASRHANVSDFDVLHSSLRDLLSEVKQLQEMEGDFISHPSSSVNERILRQNEELTHFVARMSEEKTELRNTLTQLEEEIWQFRQMDSKYQDMQRNAEHGDHIIVAERAEWAKEKLSLQMALNSAEREIDLLQTDLRVERERRVAAGITEAQDNDKIKIQRLYGKYLRAESFKKALVYQKKYLLVLLGGFQDTEETTLAMLSRMGAVDHRTLQPLTPRPLTRFRAAARVVVAISRMRYLVKKWRRATRVGSEVVGGTTDQNNGYVPQYNSYTPPKQGTSPRYSSSAANRSSSAPIRSSSSPSNGSMHRQRSPLPSSDLASSYRSQSPHFDLDPYSAYAYQPRSAAGRMQYSPPKKDYSSATNHTSPSIGARRKILTSASIPGPTSRVRFTSDTSNNGSIGDSDEYINRLESLQSRLGSLQSGRRKQSRHQPWR